MDCAIEIKDTEFNICDQPIGGLQKFVQLYYYTDWLAMKQAGNTPRGINGEITNILNTVGKKAYRFDQPDNAALDPKTPVRPVPQGIPGFDHSVLMSIMGNKQDEKNILLAMLHKLVVVVVLAKNGRGVVYGDDQGLQLTSNEFSQNSPLGTVIPITLLSDATAAPERRPPLDVWSVDEITTATLIAGLNTVGV